MVVDDEPAVAMVLRLTLQKCGYVPEVYTLPMDAWNRFAQTPENFDLLMIDQNMPDIDGPEFILRARKISPSIPIIIMGGRLERSEMFSDQEISGVSALKKPFEVAELIAVVDHSLQEVRHV